MLDACPGCRIVRGHDHALRIGRHLILVDSGRGGIVLLTRRCVSSLALLQVDEAQDLGLALAALARSLAELHHTSAPDLLAWYHVAWHLPAPGIHPTMVAGRVRALISRAHAAPAPPWRRRPGHARTRTLRAPERLPGE